jgi:hypothetical protein
VDKIQSILPRLPHDGATINVFFKRHLEYKSPYMSRNVRSNVVMVVLQDLIETPLYKDLNVNIHHQWTIFFALHMNSKSQIPTYNNASSNTFDFDNEEIHCTPTDSMMHNFLNVQKIMDYENMIYFIAPSQDFYHVGLFKDKHLEELNFLTLFYGQPR